MAEKSPRSFRQKLSEVITTKELLHNSILATGLFFLSLPAINEFYRSNQGSHDLEQNYPNLLTKNIRDQKVNAIYREFSTPNRGIAFRFTLPEKYHQQIEEIDTELAQAKQTRLTVLRNTPGFLTTSQADNVGLFGFTIATASVVSKIKRKTK